MQIVSPEMAEKLLKMIEAGAENVNTQLAELMDQLIKYVVFIEILNVLKWGLLFFGAVVVARAFNFWILAADSEAGKMKVKGWRNIIVGLMTGAAVWTTMGSALGLGKILLAPKIYLIELALDKVKAIKGETK